MKRIYKILIFTLCINLIFTLSVLGDDTTNEQQASKYYNEIKALYDEGIILDLPDDSFVESDYLTKGEAAELFVNAFELPLIYPMEIKDKTIEKSYSYEDSLSVIDESFTIPSADDITYHKDYNYIESLYKAKVVEIDDRTFEPYKYITKSEYSDILCKLIFGVNLKEGQVKKAVELGFIDEDLAYSNECITKEGAAHALYNVIFNKDFEVLTIMGTADIHSHLVPYKPRGANYNIGALGKMAKVVKDMREREPEMLLIDCGDAPYNTNLGNLFEGRSTIDVMNLMGYDAMAIGNHDFDFPIDIMERNANRAKFPFLSANTYYKEEYPKFLKPYIVKEVEGYNIGIIGLTDDQSIYYTHPKNVEGITLKDHFQVAQEAVKEIQDETDIIIALAHLHADNPELPIQVKGIDIEIGGGQDKVADPELINDTWLISPGKHSEVCNQINVNMYKGKMIGMNFSHIFMSENLPEDKAVEKLIARYNKQLGEKMKDVVGKTEVELDGERATVRLKESNLGNLIADSLIDITGADVAIQNGGGIRASIDKGDITMEEIYAILPFDNTVVVVEASGKTIWDTLEHGIAGYPEAYGSFPQVAGMKYTFDASKKSGERLKEVIIKGEPIDLNKTYKLVTNDFLTGGGDKFTMLKENTKEVLKTKLFLRDALVEYLQKVKIVSPKTEGRIKILN